MLGTGQHAIGDDESHEEIDGQQGGETAARMAPDPDTMPVRRSSHGLKSFVDTEQETAGLTAETVVDAHVDPPFAGR